jgi:acetamidase/formamidase
MVTTTSYSSKEIMMHSVKYLFLIVFSSLISQFAYSQSAKNTNVDIFVKSTPENVTWGYLPLGRQPIVKVKPGQKIAIDTLSHQGIINGIDPVKFFQNGGVKEIELLPELMDVYKNVPKPKDSGAHVMTGPIYVEGAEPGDLLEVRIIDLKFRVPYGVNNSNKGGGVLPEVHEKAYPKIIRFDLKRNVALFSPGVEIPLAPFMGIMALLPSDGLSSTRPPGTYGGNMDMNRLTKGSSLYLPVVNSGALFYTGDAHAVQGDGEVNGTAIETSLTPVFQFIVHKNKGSTMKFPRAEDAKNYYVMGMDRDLNIALKEPVNETVHFLKLEKGMSAEDAYSFASIAVNYVVGEAVDDVLMIYGEIPKKNFVAKTKFWSQK